MKSRAVAKADACPPTTAEAIRALRAALVALERALAKLEDESTDRED